MLAWLRDFTDLPLGVYPNLGYLSDAGWRSTARSAGPSTRSWRCGGARRARRSSAAAAASGRAHIEAARRRARRHAAGRARGRRAPPRRRPAPAARARRRWADGAGRDLFPLPFPDIDLRAGRVRADAGQLPRLAPPVPRAGRRRRALPRRRLRQRPARRSSSPQRRRARARDRPRRARGGEHAHERVPQRRRRPRDRGDRGPVSVGARRALRRDRGEPVPDAGRPVRAGREPSAARLLGPQPDRPPDRASCPRRSRRAGSPT